MTTAPRLMISQTQPTSITHQVPTVSAKKLLILTNVEILTQDTQVLRVNTTVENASNKLSTEHLYDREPLVDMKANLHEAAQGTQTSPTKIEEKPKITPQIGKHAPESGGRRDPCSGLLQQGLG